MEECEQWRVLLVIARCQPPSLGSLPIRVTHKGQSAYASGCVADHCKQLQQSAALPPRLSKLHVDVVSTSNLGQLHKGALQRMLLVAALQRHVTGLTLPQQPTG
jgi:hypothetical protein